MAQPKKCNTDALYFSARLTEKLRGMLRAKTTLMEAPSGYGKTTAARAFFQRHLPEGAEFIRHVCLSEPPLVAWQRFCRTMQKIDAEAGSRLLQLGLPDEYTKGEAVSLLREMECAAPTWLVMDDFQHLKDLVSVDVWKAFAEHDAAHFHLVVLAQILSEPDIMPYVKHGLLYVDSEDLRLREQEIGEYFSAAGLPLAENEIREAYRRTEGWIVALYLHMLHYRATGEFSPASGIRALLREIIWNRLNAAEKDFLLRVSPFDGYTARQAARLLNIPELLGQKFPGGRSRFGKSSFIRYDPASRRYYPHNTLLEFVREVFAEAPESLQREILYHAGDWCAEHREREKAIAFYYRLRDFEKILALDLTGMEEAGIGGYISGVGYAEVLRDIVEHCTTEMKTRWPMSMLHLAFELFGRGAYEEFGRLCAEMEGLIAQTGLTLEEKNRLQGELLLLKALSEYNNIAAMGELMRQASGLAGGKPSLINLANSWTFGNASALLMFHTRVGCLDAELADMESYCQYYVAMTQGHGSGGDVLMQAEALLCRGEMGAAEILGHKAWYQAKLRGQSSICIASTLLSGRLAIYNGKAGEFSSLLERMARQAEKNPQKS
ncbi:MAG: hypothetical protein LBV76_01645, partial [Deltaproteobacteria bacterium]|nr:hypothetical protein [Deltaproteobacteria bacterium]